METQIKDIENQNLVIEEIFNKDSIFSAINLDNQFFSIKEYLDKKKLEMFHMEQYSSFYSYVEWIEEQTNPDKSYRKHPIESEQQLDCFKHIFDKTLPLTLGAYIRIKRVYYLLNNTSTTKNNQNEDNEYCQFCYINTPIGNMLAVFSQDKLCLLEFLERKMLETELLQIKHEINCSFVFSKNEQSKKLQKQLNEYFNGSRETFDIPIKCIGTEFQQSVWQCLQKIPYGTTVSYAKEANMLNSPNATRAVANANGKNKISIIIPCHRVIRKNGEFGGYGGGINRKRYLLQIEKVSFEK